MYLHLQVGSFSTDIFNILPRVIIKCNMGSSTKAKEGKFSINITKLILVTWYHVFIILYIQGVINKVNVIIY